MAFGRKASKVNTPKGKEPVVDEVRNDLIVQRIRAIVNHSDAGVIDINRIKHRVGVAATDELINRCIKENFWILHKGWVYNNLWTKKDIEEISVKTFELELFENYDPKIDEIIMMFLRKVNDGSGIRIEYFETSIDKGVLGITKEQLYGSIKRLMRAGEIYEPVIGFIVPTTRLKDI